MQLMQALVGCQKRWTKSLRRRFQSFVIVRDPIEVAVAMIARRPRDSIHFFVICRACC
jgi:hypothetical protein